MNKHDTVVPSSRLDCRATQYLTSPISKRSNHFNDGGEGLSLFWASGIKWYVGDSLHLGRLVTPEQARWVKTVKVLLRIAKSSQDQTVGSTLC